MVRVQGGLVAGFLALCGFVVAGCDSAPAPVAPPADHAHDHDHDHDHSHDHGHEGEAGEHSHEDETYASAVQDLTELNDEISAAFAKDDSEAADKPVHEFGHVLEEIVELAEKAELSGDDLAAIKKAVDQLFDDVGKVDSKIHGGEGATYAEVETQVSEALATLKKYVPVEK